MQNITPLIPSPQLPDGWAFPTLAQVNGQDPAAPVLGGGGVAATMTKVRWGRLLMVLAGLAILGFGAWSIVSGGINTKATPRAVAGGAVDEADLAKDARVVGGGTSTPPAIAPPSAPMAAMTKPPVVPARRASRATGIGAAALARTTKANAIPVRTVAGGGGPSAQPAAGTELPLTGIESWIAAILGIVLLGVGICVHVNAVRIGMTAMLYRRGILLRPVDCARLAQRRGIPRARIVLSDVLHRLLAEPATRGEFVSMRRTAN